MKKMLLFFIPVIGFMGFSFFYKGDKIMTYHTDGIESVNYWSNPPTAKTGAPGEGNCTECHLGSVMSGDGVISFDISGGPGYTPGSTFPITISTSGGSKNGFQLTILDEANNMAGSFSAGPQSSVTSSGGREYIRHSSSAGITSWTFNWTAPATDVGELTAYYSMVKANSDGTTSGDNVYLANTAIPLEGAGIKESELDKAYRIYFNEQTRELNLSYSLLKEAKVVLNIQDLSGRLIEYYDLGNQPSGDYNENLTVSNVDKQGVYVLSLFVDNEVFNRKVVLK